MGVWTYNNQASFVTREVISQERCLYCKTRLDVLPDSYEGDEVNGYEELTQVAACPVCGWWKLVRLVVDGEQIDWKYDDHQILQSGERFHWMYGAVGSLRELDLEDIRAPLGEVRNYLSAKYEERFRIHPRLFEETVASVFSDVGHKVIVTAYSGDGGIDVILEGPNCTTIGVQVKRYKSAIKIEQIRSLAGALLLGGHTKGVFVTTSGYQSGVKEVAKRFAVRGHPIELVDAKKFYETLCIAQRNKYKYASDRNAPFYELNNKNLIRL